MRVHLRGLGFARRYPGQQAVTPGLKSWLVLLLVTLLFGYSLKARAESLMASADTLDSVEVRLELAQHDADQQGIEPVSWFRPADSAAVLASDPFEPMNRMVFDFNEQLDRQLIRPAAKAYIKAVPRPLREGLSNMLLNLDDLVSLVNQLLQGKPSKAAISLARFLVNSSIGVIGFFDVATESGLYHETEDLGQTFAVWGVPSGPYLVLPLFGPSTLRDATARVLFQPFIPLRQITPLETRYALITTGLLSARAEFLEASQSSGLLVIDRYLFARDAFLQRRRNQIYDGEPPE
ncbi:MAG: VacJ family lipoprotein [Betaproteobacteria bacterium]|nr:VacJ family lipoprotein [Betaproteobacteria bacterium]